MNESRSQVDSLYGERWGGRHQIYGSGAWPWAMMEEADCPLLTAASPWACSLQWEAGQTA